MTEVKEKLYLYMDESSAPYDLYESTPEDDLFDEMIIEKYHLSSGENDESK